MPTSPRQCRSPPGCGDPWPACSSTWCCGRWERATDRLHPAREELPRLSGNRTAWLQAAWRHLLFGIVLGELERRMNAQPEPPLAEPEADYSSNGHGSLEHAASVQQGS